MLSLGMGRVLQHGAYPNRMMSLEGVERRLARPPSLCATGGRRSRVVYLPMEPARPVKAFVGVEPASGPAIAAPAAACRARGRGAPGDLDAGEGELAHGSPSLSHQAPHRSLGADLDQLGRRRRAGPVSGQGFDELIEPSP